MSPLSNFKTPRALLRGVFFSLVSTLLCCCDSEQRTPDWPATDTIEQALAPKENYQQPLIDAASTRFVSYNLRNYLSMPRGSDRASMLPKPEHEIVALISNIQQSAPDVLGICEIGTSADLADLQVRLKSAGLELPYTHLTGGADAYRRLALLSKFPITVHSEPKLTYTSEGVQHKILRGILDCSIDLPTGETRFVGVHLKSKRPSKYWNQERIRRDEAELVRQHVSSILKNQPRTNLVVYGDFNDSKQSPVVRAISGHQNTVDYLRPLNLKDSNGTKWTHYWAHQDIYSRLDYVFISAAMQQRIDHKNSLIIAPPANDPASDHRPLVVTIR